MTRAFWVPPIAVAALCWGMLALQACTPQSVSPQNAIVASSAAIEEIARQVGAAQKLGQISVEREAALLDRLQVANDALRTAEAVRAAGGDGTALLERVSAELTRIRTELAQEPQP